MNASLILYGAVAAGSALGAVSRALCSMVLLSIAGPDFPWGTLAINVAGSFLIGLYAAVAGPGGRFSAGPVTRQFVMAGFCGGFTTFSIFSLETIRLIEQQAIYLAFLNVLISVALWLIAVWAGNRLGVGLNRT